MRKSDIEGRLRDHYVRVRLEEAPDPAAKARAVALVAAEAGQEAPAASMRQAGFARFVLGQIRYVRTWVWAAQAGLLALLACGSLLAPTDETASACTAVVAALTVLVGMPDVLRSRESNVMELEYACRFDSCQVLAARLSVLGLSDVVVLTFAVLAVPALAGTDPLLVFLHACAPFFLTAAGSLRIATRAREGVTARCLVFGTLVATLAVMAWQAAPRLYAASAAGLWAVLFALALVAAALETKAYLSSVAAGLDCLGAPAQP